MRCIRIRVFYSDDDLWEYREANFEDEFEEDEREDESLNAWERNR